MNWTNFFSVLADAFDSGHCLELVREIWENDRWFTFSAFERTAAFCERQMREAGLSEVERLPLKADGHTAYGDWVIPRAWDVSEAYLGAARWTAAGRLSVSTLFIGHVQRSHSARRNPGRGPCRRRPEPGQSGFC